MVDEATITPLYDEWARAVAERDNDALDELFDPSYSYTSPDGVRMTRAEIMALEMRIPPPELPFLNFSIQPVTDDVIIVRGGHALQGVFPEGSIRPGLAEEIARGIEIAFTSTWHFSGGRWRVVSNDAHVVRTA